MLVLSEEGMDVIEPRSALDQVICFIHLALITSYPSISYRWGTGAQEDSLFPEALTGSADPTHFILHRQSLFCSLVCLLVSISVGCPGYFSKRNFEAIRKNNMID